MNISIVISTYGADSWRDLAWARAHPSARAQDTEVIIGHDPDATIAQVRNELATKATGEWLCFLDADDELAPGFLAAIRRAYEQRPTGTPASPPLLTPAVSYVRKGRPQPAKFNDRGISLRDDNWLIVGTVIHKTLFHEVGGFNDYEHGFEDFSLWSKCWRIGAKVVKVPDAVYVAHINPQSNHRQRWRDRKWQVRRHMEVVAELDAWEKEYKGAAVLG